MKYLGYVWAAPVTFFGLVYALLFAALGWHSYHGVEGDALVWTVNHKKAPKWLLSLWKTWAGHAIGNVVVLRDPVATSATTLVHEQKHVNQVMRLGPFAPFAYGLIWLTIKVACPGSNPYYDNSLEIDARRAAGQKVDVRK